MSKESNLESLETTHIYEIKKNRISWAVDIINQHLEKRMDEKDRMMWEAIREVIKDLSVSSDLEQFLYRQVTAYGEMVDDIINVLSEVSSKIPKLENQIKQLKKRKETIKLEAKENIIKTIEKIQECFDRAEKASKTYLA